MHLKILKHTAHFGCEKIKIHVQRRIRRRHTHRAHTAVGKRLLTNRHASISEINVLLSNSKSIKHDFFFNHLQPHLKKNRVRNYLTASSSKCALVRRRGMDRFCEPFLLRTQCLALCRGAGIGCSDIGGLICGRWRRTAPSATSWRLRPNIRNRRSSFGRSLLRRCSARCCTALRRDRTDSIRRC